MAIHRNAIWKERFRCSWEKQLHNGGGSRHFRYVPAVLFTFILSALALVAQPGEPDLIPSEPDTTALHTDSLSAADSLALADTVQPELRVGAFGGPLFTTATVANIPVNPMTRTGLHAGIRAEMEFGYPIYFLVEFEYAQKGIRSTYVLTSGTMIEEEFFFNYLDVPILYRVGIPITSRFSLSGGFGGHVSLLLSRKHVLRIGEVDSTISIERGLENFDFGIEGRIGGEFALAPKWGLTADLRYLHGLQNILILEPTRRDERSWKSRSLFFSAGIMYQLQRSIR